MKTAIPKRYKAEDIEKLLGEKAIQRLRIAYLRSKAAHITPVTTKQIKLAREYVTGEQTSTSAAAAFRNIAFKWTTEAKGAHKAFMRYTADLAGTTKYDREVKTDAKTKKK